MSSSIASGPAANSLSTIQVTFDRAVNPSTLTSSDIGLVGPGGKAIAVVVAAVAGTGDRTFSITFATQTTGGVYTLNVVRGVKTPDGLSIKAYQTTFTIVAPPVPGYVSSSSASGSAANNLSTIQVTFDRAVNPSTLTSSDIGLVGPGGKAIAVVIAAVAGTGSRTFSITFATQTTAGVYTLNVGAGVKTPDGLSIKAYQTTFTIVAPTPATLVSTTAFTANTLVAIPPSGSGVSLLKIAQPGTVANLTVKVDIKYPHVGDLVLRLQSPDGTIITLANQVGGTNVNLLNTTFSDQASKSILFAGGSLSNSVFQPQTPLAQFAGKSVQGVWKLWVFNRGTGTGTLMDWSLTVTPGASK